MNRIATFLILVFLAVSTQSLFAKETVATEASEHPRIELAIKNLEDAIDYMEKAPHNFGGHKADAIKSSKAALKDLRKALAYRAKQDNKK